MIQNTRLVLDDPYVSEWEAEQQRRNAFKIMLPKRCKPEKVTRDAGLGLWRSDFKTRDDLASKLLRVRLAWSEL